MSLGAEDLAAAQNALKVIYTDEELQLKIEKDHPLYAAMRKSTARFTWRYLPSKPGSRRQNSPLRP